MHCIHFLEIKDTQCVSVRNTECKYNFCLFTIIVYMQRFVPVVHFVLRLSPRQLDDSFVIYIQPFDSSTQV